MLEVEATQESGNGSIPMLSGQVKIDLLWALQAYGEARGGMYANRPPLSILYSFESLFAKYARPALGEAAAQALRAMKK